MTPMRVRYLALPLTVCLLANAPLIAQRTSIYLHPVRLQQVGDTVDVKVWTPSKSPGQGLRVYSINSNTSANVSRTLAFNPSSGYYEVRFPLTGFPDDTVQLKLDGSSASPYDLPVVHKAGYTIIPDALPQIVLNNPVASAVASPDVKLKAKVTDNTDSVRLIYTVHRTIDSYIETYSTWDSVNTWLDLSASNGRRLYLLVQALDSNNQASALEPIPLYAETSPYLTEYFVTDGLIIDFNHNKLLVINEGTASNPRIVSLPGGGVTAIPFTGKVNTGYLTPQGAVLDVEAPSTNRDSLYDFNGGNLYPIGPLTRGSLKTAGDYSIWTYGNPLQLVGCVVYSDSLLFRNLAGKTNQLIGYAAQQVNAQSSVNSLQPDGTVWLVDSAARMVKYHSNVRTIVVDPPLGCGGELPASPVADSFSVAYMEADGPMTMIKWNKAGSLMSQISISRRPGLDYQVNGKYLAYSNIPLASQGTAEIRLADTMGGNTLLGQGGRMVSYLEWLTRTGDLMYIINSNVRWLALQGGSPLAISSGQGKTYYRNENWYIAIGNTLFGLDLSISPAMITNDTLEVPAQASYQFKATDFTANYGPSALVAIKITALPKHGVLKKGDTDVVLNQVINKVDIDQLVYHSGNNAVTADTIRWNGFNGLTYAAADGMLTLLKVVAPAKPAITGVNANYCDNQGMQKIKISNWPAATPATVVLAKLDNGSLSVNAADSSVSFQVNGLAAGAHALTVTFSNIAGAKDTIANFTVMATVTPEVNLSANITTVVTLANPVIVTATNAAGGGSTPLYTFAKDKNISTIWQAESAAATLSIDPATLAIGNNKVYVRMKTSATCYTVQTNVDSLLILRDAATGIIDADNPGRLIIVSPNPFGSRLSLSGLASGKTYRIVLYNTHGQAIHVSEVKNRQVVDIPTTGINPGIYWLSIYDAMKKLIGTEKVIKY